MIYLIAKYTFLFLAAAILGFLLGSWWTRRRFVDVSESYESLKTQGNRHNSSWEKLWKSLSTLTARIDGVEHKIAEIPQPAHVDLTGVTGRLDRVGTMLTEWPKPETVNLAPIQDRVHAVETLIKGLPKPERPETVNLEPLHNRFVQLETALQNQGNDVDLNPVYERMNRLEQLIRNLPVPEKPKGVDLAPLNQRMGSMEGLIRQVSSAGRGEKVDLDPVNTRISGVERALRELRIPGPANLGPVESRLREIEIRLEKLANKPAPVAVPAVPTSGPRLMKTASFGKKDDLKRISGVGPKLERLLNNIGVFYFWQVASWSTQDVHQVDEMLEVFKGRIERDEWVRQAKQLKLEPTSAKEPA